MNKKKLLLIILIPVSVVAATLSVVLPVTLLRTKKDTFTKLAEETPTSYSDEKERVEIHTDIQHAYLNGPIENINLYVRGVEELSRPKLVEYTWEEGNSPFTVYLSEQKDYSDSFVYNVDKKKVSFDNLKIDTKYYFKVMSEGTIVKEDSFLTSNEVIRNMHVSGVTNVRDLGGYKAGYDVVKQGLIFRTAKLNHNSTATPQDIISAKGKDTMLNVMKVKSEIDLRGVSNNEVGGLTEGVGVLGESVYYYQCPMDFNRYDDAENRQSLRKVFEILGNSDNYPLFFHCSIGTDRTGYIAWLINAVLGVKEGYLWRDYLFSNFGVLDGKRNVDRIKDRYVAVINNTSGKTLKDKAENYLLERGVKQTEIDALRSIML